jgi:hypothetical protein
VEKQRFREDAVERMLDRLVQLYLKLIEKKSYKFNNLLGFYSEIMTSNNKSCSAYALFDSGASHGFNDEGFARPLGLAMRTCGKMRVTIANNT